MGGPWAQGTPQTPQRSLQFLQAAQRPDGHGELVQLVVIQVSGKKAGQSLEGSPQGASEAPGNGRWLWAGWREGLAACWAQGQRPEHTLGCSSPIAAPRPRRGPSRPQTCFEGTLRGG